MEITVDLDIDTALKLRAMAQAQDRSVDQLIQEVLRAYTSRYKRPCITGLGEFDSGETDVSERAREILKEAVRKGEWP
ncbi:MAG: ribbon-helix-helix domain-containing protein [Acidobacteriia bacterium]|nr:ribbon-helix-helix domain-containing protein [Terriglobia bacterium]